MHEVHTRAEVWLEEWERPLGGRLVELLTAPVSPSPRSRDLRQNSPFAGASSEEEWPRELAVARSEEDRWRR